MKPKRPSPKNNKSRPIGSKKSDRFRPRKAETTPSATTTKPSIKKPPHQSSRRSGPKPSSADLLHLYGLHTVRSAMLNQARKKSILFATDNGAARLGDKVLNSADVAIEITTTSALDQLVGAEAVHQGLVLRCSPLDTLDASELFHLADAKLVLVLDQVTDPHNVGAILRSATALGVDAVLVTSRNSAAETAVLAKSASGALDMVRLVHLRNLSKGIAELNDMGFISIGLDSEGPLVLEETLSECKANQVALVLGSEGKGLRQQTTETCSALARLDMPGPIKSLNVSNAAVLSLYVVASHLRTTIS